MSQRIKNYLYEQRQIGKEEIDRHTYCHLAYTSFLASNLLPLEFAETSQLRSSTLLPFDPSRRYQVAVERCNLSTDWLPKCIIPLVNPQANLIFSTLRVYFEVRLNGNTYTKAGPISFTRGVMYDRTAIATTTNNFTRFIDGDQQYYRSYRHLALDITNSILSCLQSLLTDVAAVPADMAVLTALGMTPANMADYTGVCPNFIYDPLTSRFGLIVSNVFYDDTIATCIKLSFSEPLCTMFPGLPYSTKTMVGTENYYRIRFLAYSELGAELVDSSNNSNVATIPPNNGTHDITTINKCTCYWQDRPYLSALSVAKRIVITTTMPLAEQTMSNWIEFGMSSSDVSTKSGTTMTVLADFNIPTDDVDGTPISNITYIPQNLRWIDIKQGLPLDKLDCKFWWVDNYGAFHPMKLLPSKGFAMILNIRAIGE